MVAGEPYRIWTFFSCIWYMDPSALQFMINRSNRKNNEPHILLRRSLEQCNSQAKNEIHAGVKMKILSRTKESKKESVLNLPLFSQMGIHKSKYSDSSYLFVTD